MAKRFLTQQDLTGNKIVNLADPTNDQDAATKKYVDGSVENLEEKKKLTFIEASTSTASGTAAKVATTSGGSYTPSAGDVILLTLSAANGVGNPTLDIDGSGAKNIQTGGVNATAVSFAGNKVALWYDGTSYQMFGSQRTVDQNTTYSEISEVNIVNTTSSTTGLVTGRRMEHYKNTNLIIDEDNMASNSAIKMPSQQSVKAYVDNGLSSKAADSDVVKLTGNQTIADVKTFSSFPVTPSSAPTTNYQVANKKYVDDNAGGGLAWSEITGTSETAAVNTGYIANNAGLVTITLPATAAVGSVVRIAGKGAGLWRVAQNSGQTINFGSLATTAGTGGYLEATNRYDAVEILCITANTTWVIVSSVGNIEVA